jgi:hypothetical protein
VWPNPFVLYPLIVNTADVLGDALHRFLHHHSFFIQLVLIIIIILALLLLLTSQCSVYTPARRTPCLTPTRNQYEQRQLRQRRAGTQQMLIDEERGNPPKFIP